MSECIALFLRARTTDYCLIFINQRYMYAVQKKMYMFSCTRYMKRGGERGLGVVRGGGERGGERGNRLEMSDVCISMVMLGCVNCFIFT